MTTFPPATQLITLGIGIGIVIGGVIIPALFMLLSPDTRPPTTHADENNPSFTSAQPAVAPGRIVAMSTDKRLYVARQLHVLQQEAQRRYEQAMQANLYFVQAVAISAKKEVEELREAWQCRICLNADVDTVLTACGHMLCLNCSSGCHQRCPFCRRQSPIIRLYN